MHVKMYACKDVLTMQLHIYIMYACSYKKLCMHVCMYVIAMYAMHVISGIAKWLS